ncbi:catalase-like [Anticarsia gemmatalis]|uniref:catalase-like n=1 Tax=Anticarsia gemmatalis TaxID=129554 RepID=UPI003F7694C6
MTLPDAAAQQLPDYRRRHPIPVGVLTKVSGEPLDLRDTVTLNTNIFDNKNYFRVMSHFNRERPPERVVQAKGIGAFGYFEVTHDVSSYTKADVFNGIGKRTPVMTRFSVDLGTPDGYRKTNYYPLHTYEIYNKYGEIFFVKFSFRTEIGVYNLSNAQAAAIRAEDRDYYSRDLYNAIAAKEYPSWRLEMDIISKDDITRVDYDPFDMTRLWKKGTYKTVPIGRLVLNRHVDNHFKGTELAVFSPDNLVPGISGPHDSVFRSRKLAYTDAQNYRLGVNFENIFVNSPLYSKTYTRDGVPPVLDNMRDAPNYLTNSFNGPVPYVDEARPKYLPMILQSNAVDLQPSAEFYNEIVESDAHRQRIADTFAASLLTVRGDVLKKALQLITLVNVDLGHRVILALKKLRQESAQTKREQLTKCFADVEPN